MVRLKEEASSIIDMGVALLLNAESADRDYELHLPVQLQARYTAAALAFATKLDLSR